MHFLLNNAHKLNRLRLPHSLSLFLSLSLTSVACRSHGTKRCNYSMKNRTQYITYSNPHISDAHIFTCSMRSEQRMKRIDFCCVARIDSISFVRSIFYSISDEILDAYDWCLMELQSTACVMRDFKCFFGIFGIVFHNEYFLKLIANAGEINCEQQLTTTQISLLFASFQ